MAVYPVADLVQFGALKVGGAKQDFDSLIEVATGTILPDTWNEVGGPASVKPFSGASALVVVQRPAAHEELASLLAGLRQLRAAQPPAEKAARNTPAGDEPVNVAYDDEFVSRTYRLNTSQDPQFVVGQIQSLEPGQWYGEGVEIRTAGSKLYLRNTRAAQQRALLRLRQMQALVSGPGRDRSRPPLARSKEPHNQRLPRLRDLDQSLLLGANPRRMVFSVTVRGTTNCSR